MDEYHLPWFKIPEGSDSKDVDGYLEKLCKEGMKQKFCAAY